MVAVAIPAMGESFEIGGYRMLHRIGEGSFGTVHKVSVLRRARCPYSLILAAARLFRRALPAL